MAETVSEKYLYKLRHSALFGKKTMEDVSDSKILDIKQHSDEEQEIQRQFKLNFDRIES